VIDQGSTKMCQAASLRSQNLFLQKKLKPGNSKKVGKVGKVGY
jgi:hypothetical protein